MARVRNLSYASAPSAVAIADGANLDAFSRLRVSNPSYLFDAQFTYGLQPLLFEAVTDAGGGSAATVTHDTTNRCALMTFTSVGSDAKAYLQSYEWIPYQPGRSQAFFLTFNFIETKTNVKKFVGVGDGSNGIFLELNGSTLQFSLYSGTKTTETVAQSAWNLDRMNGRGPSRLSLDVTKCNILIIDFQALYVGRVRVGFDIDGVVYYVHQFDHANHYTVPYIQRATLPIRAGMTASGSASTTMRFICCSAMSEGGNPIDMGFSFAQEGTGTAGSGTAAHILSLRPAATLNSIINRVKIALSSIEVTVTGTNPVKWDVCIGQAISGTTTYTAVNSTYSAMEYNTAGTISGSPALILASGYTAASAANKTSTSRALNLRYPITLDAAGAVRANGTLSVIATGIGGTSATRVLANWVEIR